MKRSRWQSKSEDFRNAIKNARALAVAEATGAPPPKLLVAKNQKDDRTLCPHCGRKFDEEVAKRHIPKCAETKAKPGRLLKGSGQVAGSNAALNRTLPRANSNRLLQASGQQLPRTAGGKTRMR